MVTDESEIFMGSHPDEDKVGEAELIPEVADRVKVWLREGIPQEERSEILKLVPRVYKDCNMNAPKLNDEIKLNLKEDAVRRDEYFLDYQNMIGTGLSLAAMALSMVLNDKQVEVDREVLLQYLGDAVKVQADLFHSWIKARKIYITPAFDKKIKTVLNKTEPTEFLFGDNIKELVSNVKAVERVGKDLKFNKKPFGLNNPVNWRGASAGKEVKQMNPRMRNYFTSRSTGYKNFRRPFQQRAFMQTQPMQRRQQSKGRQQ